jgi:hypothetical protein
VKPNQRIRALIVLVGLVMPMILWRKIEEFAPSQKGQFAILVLWTVTTCLAVAVVTYLFKVRDIRSQVDDANAAAQQRVYREVSRNVTLMRRLVLVYGILFHEEARPSRFVEWHDTLIAANGGPEEVLRKTQAGTPLDYPDFADLSLPAADATEWESARCILAGVRDRQFDRRP